MMTRFFGTGLVVWVAFCGFIARGTSVVPVSDEHQTELAAGVFRGTVVGLNCYENPAEGGIFTRATFRVDETFKGTLPGLVEVSYRGGTLGDRGESSGSTLQLQVGDERLMFVSRRGDGTLFATLADASVVALKGAGQKLIDQLRVATVNGVLAGSDLTDQAGSAVSDTPSAQLVANATVAASSSATNLTSGVDGIPARFVLPDRGEPIPYLIDADYLPAGITQTQAVLAVQAALAAWTNVTSLRYKFAGIQSFGKAAYYVTNVSDGYLRIQLHDHYNFVSGGTAGDVLGDGGHSWTIQNVGTWSTGGNVQGNDFHRVIRGFVMLQHTNVFMQNITNFTEVLTHEIGHTIGLGHSSQNPSEANSILKQAVMYYMAHGDGRGALLNSFDINVSRQVHPVSNTPPYCFDRFLDVVTSSVRPINVPGVNSAQVRGYDLQNNSLTFATAGATPNSGTFSVSGSNITYVPKAAYADSTRLDPASGSYYDIIYARYSDGVNASPFAMVRVISFNLDSYNEGIPDTWRSTYFGSANPSTGLKHHANDDADGDTESNLQEYLCGVVPTSAASNLKITSFANNTLQWQAKPYEVYEVLSSTNFVNWTRLTSPRVSTNTVGIATGCTNGAPRQFLRVMRVP